MGRPPYLIEALLVGVIWAGLAAFLLYDTPRIIDAAQVTASPSFWHYLDAIAPREDTAHYIKIGG